MEEKIKRKKKIAIFSVIVLILFIMFVYWLMYWKIGFTAAEQYYENKSGQIVTLSIIQDDYFPSLVDYDKLSRVYKRSISEEELNEANTDAKRLALYRKVQSLKKNLKSILICLMLVLEKEIIMKYWRLMVLGTGQIMF